MIIFRIIAVCIPQVLLLLTIGGSFDLLGGWNRTDGAFGTMLLLFLLSPMTSSVLLLVEIIKYLKLIKGESGRPSFLMPGLALLLLFESLVLDIFILSQVRMH